MRTFDHPVKCPYCHRSNDIEIDPDGDHARGEMLNIAYLAHADERRLSTWYGRYLDTYERRGDEWRIMHTLARRGLLLSVYRGAWGNAVIKAAGNATAYPTIVFHKLDNLAAAVEAFQGSTLEQLWPHLSEASDQEEEPPEHEDE